MFSIIPCIESFDIPNRGTHASRSVALLRSTYRWMLTGTPVTNTLYVQFFTAVLSYPTTPSADIYGLIRFGRFRPWNDWESFKQYIVRSFAFCTFCFSSSFRQRCSKRMRRLRVSKLPVWCSSWAQSYSNASAGDSEAPVASPHETS